MEWPAHGVAAEGGAAVDGVGAGGQDEWDNSVPTPRASDALHTSVIRALIRGVRASYPARPLTTMSPAMRRYICARTLLHLLVIGMALGLVPALGLAATCIQNGGSQACHRPVVLWRGGYPAAYPYPNAPDQTPYTTPPYASPVLAMNDIAAHAVQVDTDCSGTDGLYGVAHTCGNGVVEDGFGGWWNSWVDYCVGAGCQYGGDKVGAPYTDSYGRWYFFVFGFDGDYFDGTTEHPVYTVTGAYMVSPDYVCRAGETAVSELPNGQYGMGTPANEWCAGPAIANAATWSPGTSRLDLRGGTDGHQDGRACSCQPVDLGGDTLVRVQTDYRNQAPFPIVWQRTYAPASAGGWHFNYDRTVSVSAAPGGATVVADVTRPNGTMLVYTGTLQGDGSYAWSPVVPGAAALAAQVASKFTATASGGAWTGFTLHNYQDQTESYDSQGRLATLENRQGYQLHFGYDAKGRLDAVDDDFGHHLTVQHTDTVGSASFTWNDWSTSDPGNSGGGQTTVSGAVWANDGAARQEALVTGISDGTETVAYGYTLNTASGTPAGGAWQLTSVTAPDGGVRTLHYAEPLSLAVNPDGTATVSTYSGAPLWWRLTGVVDENGSRYRTFFGSPTISGETLGGTLEPLRYGGGQIVLPDSNSWISVSANAAGQLTRNYAYASSLGSYSFRCPDWLCVQDFARWYTAVYDPSGWASQRTDFSGTTETQVIDPVADEPSSVTEAANVPALARTTATAWDTRFRLPDTRTLPVVSGYGLAGGTASGTLTTVWTWDGSARLTGLTETASTGEPVRAWSFGYDALGLPTTVTTPATALAGASPWTQAWNADGTLASVTDPLGHTTTYAAYTPEGLAGSITDANGLVTTLGHDAQGRVTEIDRGGEATLLVYQASGSGLLDHVVRPDGVTFGFGWNAAHWLTQVQEKDSGGNLVGTLTLAYTPMGQVAARTVTDGAGNTVSTRSTGYDTLWRPHTEAGAYAGETSTFGLDVQNRVGGVLDPDSRAWRRTFDALGRLASFIDPTGHTTVFGYDPQDDVTSLTDPRGLLTTYGYDAFGDLLRVSSPDSGLDTFTVDAAGRRTGRTDARGVTTAWTFDALDRPLTATLDSTGVAAAGLVSRHEIRTFGYDGCAHGVGRLCSATDAAGSHAFAYDLWGRMIQDAFTPAAGSGSLTVGYGYNGAGQLISLTYPSGAVLTLAYAADGSVTGEAWNGTPILTQALHQPFDGPVLGWTWGAAVAGGVSFRYDRDSRLTALGDGGTTSDEHDYAYDPASLLLSTTVPAHPAWNATYLHDPASRLAEAAFPNQTPALTYDYRYDFNGNRTTRSYAGTQDTLTTPLASNRLLAFAAAGGPAAPRSLDAAGNLVDDGAGSTYAYGPDGRLEQADTPDGSESLTYGFAGRLRRRQIFTGLHPGTVFYAYDTRGRRLGAYTPQGTPLEEYAYLDDRLVALIRNGTVYPILTDPNGAVRQVLDPATGSPLWTWEAHEPFGDTPPQEVNGFTFDARFPGQWHDDVTGLAFNGYRDYDPRVGRYIEPDPSGLAAGPNPYAYVDNEPLGRTDPEGLAWQASVGFNVTGAFIFFGTGGSINIGINSNGSLFFDAEGHGELGVGAYLGAGFQGGINHVKCDVAQGWSHDTTGIVEADAGYGPSIGGGVALNGQTIGAFTGLGKLGVGGGVWGGVGVDRSYTYTTPTVPKMVNSIGSWVQSW